jgi:uncharacterized damage-inducible protein DinB/predicted RNase H-like HicB family nuclease
MVAEYGLYLESGPRRRKTMVHVLDLLGCVARGPTTEEALEATPDAIRAYLRFLQRHGESVAPQDPFTTVFAEHAMEGPWLGNGNPSCGFTPDFEPLSAQEQAIYLRRLAWLREDLLELIRALSPEQLLAEPEGRERSIYRILDHIAEAQGAYIRAALGKVDGLHAALRAVRQDPESIASALTGLWQVSASRLEAITEAERQQTVQRGQVTWTVRRAFRRLLEHEWEHLVEIAERLGTPP